VTGQGGVRQKKWRSGPGSAIAAPFAAAVEVDAVLLHGAADAGLQQLLALDVGRADAERQGKNKRRQAEALVGGRLIKPFDVALPAEFAYYLVCPPDRLRRPKVNAFRDWLLLEASASVGMLEPMVR
jgi:LysR family glycine cleavage system transcriptional activator